MVYVDQPIHYWRGKFWCRLFADSPRELHEFALELGLKPEWFQEKKGFLLEEFGHPLTESNFSSAMSRGRKVKGTISRIEYTKKNRSMFYGLPEWIIRIEDNLLGVSLAVKEEFLPRDTGIEGVNPADYRVSV